MNGIINFYKPKGMSSHTAVNFFRRKLNMKRIGHTGTLDPEVAGVLPLCIGKATRVSEYLLNADKEYIGEITLGIETDSQDAEGRVIKTSDKRPSREEIIEVFSRYQGELSQVPPMYSAVRHKGRHLYELAREGEVVERKARNIYIYENEILDIREDKILFRVRCSKGTYIRTLCSDIARDLGTFGYMSYLIRISVDEFKIEDAWGKETIESLNPKEIEKLLIPMDFAVRDFPALELADEDYVKISHGSMVELDQPRDLDLLYRVYSRGEFIGLGEVIKKDTSFFIKMKKVLLT